MFYLTRLIMMDVSLLTMWLSDESLRLCLRSSFIVCECSHLDCTEVIPISIEEYELIHRERARFVMVRAHVVQEIERVISDLQNYVVVQKMGAGKRVAEDS